MSKKYLLRLLSLIMLVIAAIFVAAALSAPTLGQVIYLGSFEFGPEQWRICYAAYAAVMVVLFITSFFVKEHQKEE